MEFRRLGRSGLKVSEVGLGCNNFGYRIEFEASELVVHKALDEGITLFDTADIYGNKGGSEEALGKILGDRRKDIVLATKFGMDWDEAARKTGGSRGHIMWSVEESLRRLKTDWIDLYQMHRPDSETPIDETLRALDDLVTQGKVRYIGNSNYRSWQAVEAELTGQAINTNRFVSCQDEYSLLVRDLQKDSIPAMERYGLGLLPYFPLASGLLTGKYKKGEPIAEGTRYAASAGFQKRYMTDENWTLVAALTAFAEKRNYTLLDLAFAWLLAQPVVSSVIAGATKPEQVRSNVTAGSWKLTAEEKAEVDKILAGEPA